MKTILTAAIALLALTAGCASADPSKPAPPPASAPTTTDTAQTWQDARYGLQIKYPSSWHLAASKGETICTIAPANAGDPSKPEAWSLTIDVPKLPPHIPGLLPMTPIVNGYLDDLRKRVKDLKVSEEGDHAIPNAKGRQVISRGHEGDGRAIVDMALFVVRGDHLFVITADCDPKDEPATRPVFDQVTGSLHWLK